MQTLAEPEIKKATRSKAHLEAFLLDNALAEPDIKHLIKEVHGAEIVTPDRILDVVNARIATKNRSISETIATLERERAKLEELQASLRAHECLVAEHGDV